MADIGQETARRGFRFSRDVPQDFRAQFAIPSPVAADVEIRDAGFKRPSGPPFISAKAPALKRWATFGHRCRAKARQARHRRSKAPISPSIAAATLLTPNRREFAEATRSRAGTETEIADARRKPCCLRIAKQCW